MSDYAIGTVDNETKSKSMWQRRTTTHSLICRGKNGLRGLFLTSCMVLLSQNGLKEKTIFLNCHVFRVSTGTVVVALMCWHDIWAMHEKKSSVILHFSAMYALLWQIANKSWSGAHNRDHHENHGQYDRPRVLGCKPVDGVLVVLSSNQLYISTFVHQVADVCVSHMMNKNGNIYLIWTENNQYSIYWFAYKYSRSAMILALVHVSRKGRNNLKASLSSLQHDIRCIVPLRLGDKPESTRINLIPILVTREKL